MPVNTYFAKMSALNLVFQTEETKEKRGSILLCEWGAAHCCTAWFNDELKVLSQLKYGSFDMLNEVVMNRIFETLFIQSDEALKVVACSAFPEAVLVPSKFYSTASNYISTIYGARSAPEFAEPVNEWQLTNVFAFPAPIAHKLKDQFPGIIFTQVYAPELKIFNEVSSANQVTINFTPKHFRVMVKRSGQLEIAQIYFYSAPLDVVYYLLKIFEELHLDKENTQLILSGLIEESSALYKDLESYFVNVDFAKPAAIAISGNENPQHFFNSISNLAACVS